MRCMTGGGGGYGDPAERAAERSSAPTCATARSATPRRGERYGAVGDSSGRRRDCGGDRPGTVRSHGSSGCAGQTAAEGLDAFVATADESIAYLTGFRPLQLERLFAVVVRAAGGGGVVVPKLDAGQVGGTLGSACARLLRRIVERPARARPSCSTVPAGSASRRIT